MDEHQLRILLVIALGPIVWFIIVYPIKWAINKFWPDSKIKRFLFKTR